MCGINRDNLYAVRISTCVCTCVCTRLSSQHELLVSVRAPPDTMGGLRFCQSSIVPGEKGLVDCLTLSQLADIQCTAAVAGGNRTLLHVVTLLSLLLHMQVVEDMDNDARFSANFFVCDPNFSLKFYVAAPLISSNGHRLGTL